MTVVDPSVHGPESGGPALVAGSPAPAGTGAAPPSWWLLTSATVSRALLAFLVGLLLWATVPAIFGWGSHVVLTGSMEPRIMTGDVVLTAPAVPGEVIPGQVVAFEDTNVPGRTVVHRAVSVQGNERITTRGDANPTDDTQAVDASNLDGIARLRVRFAGLPVAWAHEGAWLPLGVFVGVLVLAFALIRREREQDLAWAAANPLPADTLPEHPDVVLPADPAVPARPLEPALDLRGDEPRVDLSDPAPVITLTDAPRQSSAPAPDLPGSDRIAASKPAPRLPRLPGAGGPLLIVLLTLAVSASLVLGTARAAWSATTSNNGNVWGVSPDAQFGPGTYVATVQGDNPLFFYRLNQAGGNNATDSSGNGRTGTYVGSWNYQVAGQPLPRNAGLGAASAGTSSCISTPLTLNNPTTYSYEVWFRTTTNQGGKIAAFEISATGTSSQYDRHLYMQNDGRLTFGVWLGYAFTISTPSSYNDGQWHQAVVTMGAGGENIYVDGFLQASNPNTASENFSGRWRFGCGNLSGWPTYPTDPLSQRFDGALSNISVYSSKLSATQVRTHWYAA